MIKKIILKHRPKKNIKGNIIYNDTDGKLNKGYSYLIYPNIDHGDPMYFDIRKYLNSSINNKKNYDYPIYILESPDVDNQKKYFRVRTHLFKLNNNNDLMIKVFNKKKEEIKIEIILYFMFL